MASATNSQNLSRTYFKLATMWDKKVGNRTSGQGVWSYGSPEISSKYPLLYVPCILSSFFENKIRAKNMASALNDIQPGETKIRDDQIWIYTMRNSDSLPKNVEEEKKLYTFVKMMLRVWCETEQSCFEKNIYLYMENNIHVCVCFFVWYFTKPNFFFKDKVMKQTTRNGIQRVWNPFLMKNEPKNPINTSVQSQCKRELSKTTDALLPKQQQQQTEIISKIDNMYNLTSENVIDWNNERVVHLNISEAISNNKGILSTKQTKKLQTLYNDYTKLTQKINTTIRKRVKVEMENSRKVTSVSPPLDNGAAQEENESPSTCTGCHQNQPNQLAHTGPGGCMEDNEVPDCWDDGM
tara:strand:+ start:10573 stop:11628 length:1056 start_codon:yes stop_codon:yes gene_type:complete